MKFDAKEIVTKYISSLHTTDFAILYLPSEGLFAEVIRPPGLVEAIQYDCRVMIAGFAAAITSGIWWRTDADFAAYDRSLAKVRFWPGICHSSGEHDRPLPRPMDAMRVMHTVRQIITKISVLFAFVHCNLSSQRKLVIMR